MPTSIVVSFQVIQDVAFLFLRDINFALVTDNWSSVKLKSLKIEIKFKIGST